MFVGSVDQERKAYIHLLLYPHGSDITSQDTKYVQSITIYTGFTRSHALHQSAPSSSPGRGIPLRCTRSLLLGPLLVTARNGAVNHPSLYSHITQLMLYALLHISLTPPHFKCRGFRGVVIWWNVGTWFRVTYYHSYANISIKCTRPLI